MADISTQLEAILTAVYGEEVRGSIHDALAAMNVESNAAMEYAATAQDSAKNSAAAAKASEDNAAASAGAAKTSETNAAASEQTAVDRATAAVNAANAAKTSEDEAAASEAKAKTSETNAAASAGSAKASEDNAAASEATATEKATASSASAEAAKASGEKAASSETAAKASETAAISAKNAAESAKANAETAAQAAASSRTASESAKTAAETAANNASSDADDAAQAASDAAASALSAQQFSGKPPKPQDGTWWIWDASQQKYLDSGIACDLVGPTGNGVEEIKLTKGDHTPGTTDIYTVKMTDGTSCNISVYNGRNGTGAGDVLGIWFDLVIHASDWTNGQATVSDSRLLALSNHKYLVGADQACRDEYLECNVQPRDITESGFIKFTSETDPTKDITVNVIRLELAANGGQNE